LFLVALLTQSESVKTMLAEMEDFLTSPCVGFIIERPTRLSQPSQRSRGTAGPKTGLCTSDVDLPHRGMQTRSSALASASTALGSIEIADAYLAWLHKAETAGVQSEQFPASLFGPTLFISSFIQEQLSTDSRQLILSIQVDSTSISS